jgi:hypothetical protein
LSKTPKADSGHLAFKPRTPDQFTRKDRSKLPDFLAQCRIYFQSAPGKFLDDHSKIMFVGSYLDSLAFNWFCIGFLRDDLDTMDAHFLDWSLFIGELESQFGDPDAQHRAELELRKLKMQENHCVLRYITEFNCLRTMLPDWSDRPLADSFYRGLPDRLKTAISGLARRRPHDLASLQSLVTTLDENYWDVKVDSNTNSSSNNQSSNKSKISGLFNSLVPVKFRRFPRLSTFLYCLRHPNNTEQLGQ